MGEDHIRTIEKEMEEGKTYYRNNNWSNREMGKKSSEKTVKNK